MTWVAQYGVGVYNRIHGSRGSYVVILYSTYLLFIFPQLGIWIAQQFIKRSASVISESFVIAFLYCTLQAIIRFNSIDGNIVQGVFESKRGSATYVNTTRSKIFRTVLGQRIGYSKSLLRTGQRKGQQQRKASM
ncbi:hypothetical protein BDW68DRAFT_42401 [Aspergillus falconensis]